MRVSEVTDQAKEVLVKLGYKQNTLKTYSVDFNMISKYFANDGLTDFSAVKCDEFIRGVFAKHKRGALSRSRFQSLRRSASILNECFLTGGYEWKNLSPWEQVPLNEYYSSLLEDYLEYRAERYSISTQLSNRSEISILFQHLQNSGITRIEQIDLKHIRDYILQMAAKYPDGIRQSLGRIRAFFRYAHVSGILERDFVSDLQIAVPPKRILSAHFSREECAKILAAINREIAVGKRDYAMLLLAYRLGLRGSDIAALKFKNIDWISSSIVLNQQKTGKLVSLPLEAAVGNALIDYIENGRPVSASKNIFLQKNAPFKELCVPSKLHNVVKKYAELAGVRFLAGDRRGIHCFRRSLGTWMLEAHVPIETISQVLGHSDIVSTKPYICTDFKNLRECALSLAGIEVQKEELLS